MWPSLALRAVASSNGRVARGFIAGFITATFLYGVLFLAYRSGALAPWLGDDQADAEVDAGLPDAAPDAAVAPQKRRRRRRHRRNRPSGHRRQRGNPDQIIETGDSLEGEAREVDMSESGGEARLRSDQIDAAFGSAMGRIRRCLLLLPEDANGAGRVVFAMRVAGSGQVSAVRLRGPRSLTGGDVGSCLRRTARSISFPSFDGTETTFSYPITFE